MFEQNYAQGLMTFHSVPSYMTGRYFAASCLMVPYYIRSPEVFREPSPGERLLPFIMKQSGYRTVMVTSHSMLQKGSLFTSFDEAKYLPPPRGSAYRTFADVNPTVMATLEKIQDEPFFFYLHVMDTHFPHILEPPYDQWEVPGYSSDQIRDGMPPDRFGAKFDESDREQLRALHDGSLLYSDAHVGQILSQLERLGILNETIILITSDHGDALGEDGKTWGHFGDSFDEISRTPWVMAGPGIPAGKRVSCLTENVDIVPTLIELLDLKTDARTDGVSLVSVMNDPSIVPPRSFVVNSGNGFSPITGLRTNAFKYEYYRFEETEGLWRVPDTVAGREDCLPIAMENTRTSSREWSEAESALVSLRRSLKDDILTRWNERQQQPFEPTTRELVLPLKPCYVVNKDVYASEKDVNKTEGWRSSIHMDNKWFYSSEGGNGLFWSNAAREDSPSITFRYALPNGKYVFSISLYANPDFSGRPASLVKVRFNDETDYRQVGVEPGVKNGYHFVDLGEHTVRDESVAITVDDVGPSHWAYFKGFRVVPLTGVTDDGLDSARQEQLRALGYVE